MFDDGKEYGTLTGDLDSWIFDGDETQQPDEGAEDNGPEKIPAPKFVRCREIYPKGSWGWRAIAYLHAKGLPYDVAALMSLFPPAARAGNWVFLRNNLGQIQANLYLMPIGQTSAGKDLLIEAVRSLIPQAHLVVLHEEEIRNKGRIEHQSRYKLEKNLLFNGNDPTGAGMFTTLRQSRGVGWYSFSEYSDHLRSSKADCKRNSPEPIFKTLFGHKPTYLPAQKQYAGTPQVENPAPSRIAVSQWNRLRDDIDRDSKEDGSMARNLFVMLPPIDPAQRISFADAGDIAREGEALAACIGRMFEDLEQDIETRDDKYNHEISLHGIPEGKREELRITIGAQEAYNDWRVGTRTSLLAEGNEGLFSFCEKFTGEYPLKLAISLAFGRQRYGLDHYALPLIDEDTMQASLIVADYGIEMLRWVWRTSDGLPADDLAVISAIGSAGKAVTYRELSRKNRQIRSLGKQRFDEVVKKYKGISICVSSQGGKVVYSA